MEYKKPFSGFAGFLMINFPQDISLLFSGCFYRFFATRTRLVANQTYSVAERLHSASRNQARRWNAPADCPACVILFICDFIIFNFFAERRKKEKIIRKRAMK
jgi:hypothetical protein